MISNDDVIRCIDRLRSERDIKIQKLVKGVVSRRTYTRYLSGEASITYDVLIKMLDNIDVPFHEFAYYVSNCLEMENQKETEFILQVFDEAWDVAWDFYLKYIKDKTHLAYREFAIKYCEIYLLYNKKIISKTAAAKAMNKDRILDRILDCYVLEDDIVLALHFFAKICSDEDLLKVKNFFFAAITENKYKIFALQYERLKNIIHLTFIYIMTERMPYNKENHEQLMNVFKIALEFDSRAKLKTFDNRLFTLIHDYYLKNNLPHNKYINYYYLSSILSEIKDSYIENRNYVVTGQDIADFKECISDRAFLAEPMYRRLLNETTN